MLGSSCFGNTIEQTERASDQQQICGNSANALSNLHSDVDRINIFLALNGLIRYQATLRPGSVE